MSRGQRDRRVRRRQDPLGRVTGPPVWSIAERPLRGVSDHDIGPRKCALLKIGTTVIITNAIKILGLVPTVFDAPIAQKAKVTVRPPPAPEFMRILQAIAVVITICAPIIILIAVRILRLIGTVILMVGDTIQITVQR